VSRARLFVGPVPEDKLPKDAVAGTHLRGEIKLARCLGAMCDRTAPTKCSLIYTVPGPKKQNKGSSRDSSDDEGDVSDGQEEVSVAEKLRASRRDAEVRFRYSALYISTTAHMYPVVRLSWLVLDMVSALSAFILVGFVGFS
jgi:hypothetical protein